MSIIKIPLRFEGENGEKILYTLFESGATYSCVRPELVKDIIVPIHYKKPFYFGTADEGRYIEVHDVCHLEFYYEDLRLTDEFYLVPGLSEEAIIGATTMQKWGHINFLGIKSD